MCEEGLRSGDRGRRGVVGSVGLEVGWVRLKKLFFLACRKSRSSLAVGYHSVTGWWFRVVEKLSLTGRSWFVFASKSISAQTCF